MAFNEADHPREPKGSPNGMGGKFAVKTSEGDDTDLTAAPISADPMRPPEALADALDPYEAVNVEFTLPDGRTVSGWAVDDARIDPDRLPDGWHKYSVMEDDDSGAIDVAPTHVVNHRFDFATTTDLGNGFQGDTDSWGFGDANLIDALPDGFDPDEYREEQRRTLMGRAIDDSLLVPRNGDRLNYLRAAARDTARHLTERTGDATRVSPYDIRPTAEAKRYGEREAGEDWFAASLQASGTKVTTRSPYVRINEDGDLEGLSEKRVETLIWRNRQNILKAVRDDEDADPKTVKSLAVLFMRRR